MSTAFKLSFISSLIMTVSVPVFASITVNSPANGANVNSPFKLSATAATCSSQAVSAMGVSLDNSSDTTILNGASVDNEVSAGDGAHTVHVKAWGDKGALCVTDIAVSVASGATSELAPPSNAVSVSSIQTFGDWGSVNDTGTDGKSSGAMSLVNSPARSGNARKFVTSFSNNGGERYHVSFGDDEADTNFLYDAWIYLTGSSNNIGNIEMDLNQVIPGGHTVIYGFQCDGWNGTWDFTKNAGTVSQPKDEWVHTGATCNPRNWSINTWHHVQISYSRNDSGDVTYNSVWLDDKEQAINATVPSAFALGWGPTLLTNFQVDGRGSGTNTVYLDDLVVYRW